LYCTCLAGPPGRKRGWIATREREIYRDRERSRSGREVDGMGPLERGRGGTAPLFHVSAIKMHPVCPPSRPGLLPRATAIANRAGPAKANYITVVGIIPPRLVLWPLFRIQCPHCCGVIAYTLNLLCLPRILYPSSNLHASNPCVYTFPSIHLDVRKKSQHCLFGL
jgi:hypothetical protein